MANAVPGMNCANYLLFISSLTEKMVYRRNIATCDKTRQEQRKRREKSFGGQTDKQGTTGISGATNVAPK
jgi:hypothetical protein